MQDITHLEEVECFTVLTMRPDASATLSDVFQNEFWDLFTGAYCSPAVQAMAAKKGITLASPLLSPMCDDEKSPKDFCDLAAAACALASGVTLVRLPDELGEEQTSFFVCEPIGETTMQDIICTAHENYPMDGLISFDFRLSDSAPIVPIWPGEDADSLVENWYGSADVDLYNSDEFDPEKVARLAALYGSKDRLMVAMEEAIQAISKECPHCC